VPGDFYVQAVNSDKGRGSMFRQFHSQASAADRGALGMGKAIRWVAREPTLAEMLSDPIVRDVMEADGVDPRELVAMLRDVAGSLRAAADPSG
jgi:hypothetical protein